jgi:mRNA interferase MazF
VILVPFPFSDLSQSKLRPALVLAPAGRGDWLLCQITSNAYGDPDAIALDSEHFRQGTLDRPSFVRPGKLFTSSRSLFVREVGVLSEVPFIGIVDAVVAILRPIRREDVRG